MKKLILLIAVVVIVILGIFWNKSTKPSLSEQNVLPGQSNSVSPLATSTKSYDMSVIATHNKAGDCWTTIDSKVYDLTTWPDKHPGGDKAILAICGIDGSAAFNKKHGGQGGPAKTLEGFYIGELVK